MTDQHRHLRQLVECRESAEGGIMEDFHVLAGTRPRLPGLSEGLDEGHYRVTMNVTGPQILNYLKKQGSGTPHSIAMAFSTSSAPIEDYLEKMVKEGKVVKSGRFAYKLAEEVELDEAGALAHPTRAHIGRLAREAKKKGLPFKEACTAVRLAVKGSHFSDAQRDELKNLVARAYGKTRTEDVDLAEGGGWTETTIKSRPGKKYRYRNDGPGKFKAEYKHQTGWRKLRNLSMIDDLKKQAGYHEGVEGDDVDELDEAALLDKLFTRKKDGSVYRYHPKAKGALQHWKKTGVCPKCLQRAITGAECKACGWTPKQGIKEDAEPVEEVLGVPDLEKWKIKTSPKHATYTIALHGKEVKVTETPEPPGSGLYRYRVFVGGKRVGTKDFMRRGDVMRTVQKAVMRKHEDADLDEAARFEVTLKKMLPDYKDLAKKIPGILKKGGKTSQNISTALFGNKGAAQIHKTEGLLAWMKQMGVLGELSGQWFVRPKHEDADLDEGLAGQRLAALDAVLQNQSRYGRPTLIGSGVDKVSMQDAKWMVGKRIATWVERAGGKKAVSADPHSKRVMDFRNDLEDQAYEHIEHSKEQPEAAPEPITEDMLRLRVLAGIDPLPKRIVESTTAVKLKLQGAADDAGKIAKAVLASIPGGVKRAVKRSYGGHKMQLDHTGNGVVIGDCRLTIKPGSDKGFDATLTHNGKPVSYTKAQSGSALVNSVERFMNEAIRRV